ncbi:MAG: hypothetical protein ACT4TC_21435 [Myxococcaceae bacterium]
MLLDGWTPPHVDAEPLRVICTDSAQRATADGLNRILISGVARDDGRVASRIEVRLGRVLFVVRIKAGMTPRQTAELLASNFPRSVRCEVLGDCTLPESDALLLLGAPRPAPKLEIFANDPKQRFVRTSAGFEIRHSVAAGNTKLSFLLLTLERETVKLRLNRGDTPEATARALVAALPISLRRSLLFTVGPEEGAPVRFTVRR